MPQMMTMIMANDMQSVSLWAGAVPGRRGVQNVMWGGHMTEKGTAGNRADRLAGSRLRLYDGGMRL